MKKLTIVLIMLIFCSPLQAATIAAAQAGNWSATATWTGGIVPVDGDIVDFNGYQVIMDVDVIPATGTLLALGVFGGSGQLLINDSSNPKVINATNLYGSSTVGYTEALVEMLTDNTTTINGNVYGGTVGICVYQEASGAVIINGNVTGGTGLAGFGVFGDVFPLTVNGNVTGGTGVGAHGIWIDTDDEPIIINGNVTGGGHPRSFGIWADNQNTSVTITGNLIASYYAMPYAGFPPVLADGSQYYLQIGNVKYPQQLEATQVLKGVNHGGLIGILNPQNVYIEDIEHIEESSDCFIATACYGTPMAEEVKVLSQFRDEYLLTNPIGEGFVRTYNKVSPRVALFITEHPVLKRVVRGALNPLIRMSRKIDMAE